MNFFDLQVRPKYGVQIVQDGVVVAASSSDLIAYAPGALREIWSLRFPSDLTGSYMFVDDNLVVADGDGNLSWWSHVHGGLAHTPAPREGMDNGQTHIAPEGPFPTEPEIQAEWRR